MADSFIHCKSITWMEMWRNSGSKTQNDSRLKHHIRLLIGIYEHSQGEIKNVL